MPDRRLERLERELMLVARCSVLTPRERKGQATEGQDSPAQPNTGPAVLKEPAPDRCTDEPCAVPTRLDRSGYLLLSRLDAEGAMSIGQLADAFQLDVSTVNRQTGALLRAGLVERIPDPAGGLARKLRITPQGADRMAAERTCRQTDLSRLLESWPSDEVARLEDVLTRFNREVERQEGRAWPRESGEA
ncbi:transcriptional regulator [Streptomyces violaceusniger]|uniref:MarR family winged helix-turn-helix transcriptional regulator n=2 Tax=Streptomyces violaceusniger group TaxID=2839105 RepID=A0ABD5JDZ3_9ACTN|nr:MULTISPECIES: MarR family winged helix-turn-helix transcriptional regulator [Streptomyces]KUL46624.1 transcriptional regulator [Streptomyces violaceusniger]MEE4586628.1 MarR family winged helix-turn-helix transcriptional regulator [Streptomyces sp. DSM 41602]